MDKDRVKGTLNDAAGRVKRQVGEWIGDTQAQVEGTLQQAKGKTQTAWGAVKDAARDANARVKQERDREHVDDSDAEDAEFEDIPEHAPSSRDR